MKKLSISIGNWVFDEYLFNATNVSARIEELIIKGSTAEEENPTKIKHRILMLKEELKQKDDEIRKLKLDKGRLEQMVDRKTKQMRHPNQTNINSEEKQLVCAECNRVVYENSKTYKFPIGLICDACYMIGGNTRAWMKPPVPKPEVEPVSTPEPEPKKDDEEDFDYGIV